MSSVGYLPSSVLAQNLASLPHYNTNVYADLPANAAPEGVLANGDVYFNSYEMLTPSDVSFLQSVTGLSLDPSTAAAEQANGTLRGDPLAAAIGMDRADAPLGWGGITGNITTSYLQSIEAAETNPNGNGTYEGFQISASELNSAVNALNANSGDSSTASTVSALA